MGLQPKPQKEPWVCTQVRLGRKGFFWGVGHSQISPFAHHQGLLHCACHLILSKESTTWRPQVRLRLIRLGLSMRWPLPLTLWREWNGYYNEEVIGLSLLRRSIRSGETNFILQSFPLLVIFRRSHQKGGILIDFGLSAYVFLRNSKLDSRYILKILSKAVDISMETVGIYSSLYG